MADQISLPQRLDKGLRLRWATAEDSEALADFNVRIHSDNPDEPDEFLRYWTADLMSGRHPTTTAAEFTVVVDDEAGGKIVSSLCTIPQRWRYEDIEFTVGRPELVGTDPAYRRRGLVQRQFAVLHARSEARGERVQAITGIPWYYRQFGYEMCVDLGGGRQFFWARPGNDKPVASEKYRLRLARAEDFALAQQLYDINCQGSLLARIRDEQQWHYEVFAADRRVVMIHETHMIENSAGQVVGYVAFRADRPPIRISELAVMPGESLRAVALFLTRHFKQVAATYNETADKEHDRIYFGLGNGHAVNEALPRELERDSAPYGWYIRVPDLPGFLRHIAPVLEKRLARSVMAGYTGSLKLNFYHSQLQMTWEAGRLGEIAPYQPTRFMDGDAFFPDLTFLQLLFGHRSLAELELAFVDLYPTNGDAAVLLSTLFPRRASWIKQLE